MFLEGSKFVQTDYKTNKGRLSKTWDQVPYEGQTAVFCWNSFRGGR